MLGWDAWSKHANTVEQAMRCTTLRDARDRYRIVVLADSCEDFPRPFALGWAGLAVVLSIDGLPA